MPFAPPTRAPQRPLHDLWWWAALVLWALNDHWLKGSGLLPGAVTGKLSDGCGLWVLPAGLSALAIRWGATHPLARLSPYLLVGIYFAGLQLWPPLIEASHHVLSALGIPSRITADPSDLWALALLPLAWLRYDQSSLLRPIPRLRLAIPSYAFLLLTTVATSRVDQPGGVQRTGRLFLYNNTAQEQQVTIRQIRDDVNANCFFIQNSPSTHLNDALFEPVETVLVQPKGLIALDARAQTNLQNDLADDPNACEAMVLSGPNRDPQLVYWRSEEFPLQSFNEVPANLKINGVIALEPQGATDNNRLHLRHLGARTIIYPTEPKAPEKASPECSPRNPRAELGWGQPFPKGPHKVLKINPGKDGCLELELANTKDERLKTRRYLCIPPERFPFEEGTTVQFRSLQGESAVIGDNIEGWRIAPPQDEPKIEFWVILGQGLPQLGKLTFGAQAQDACPYAPTQDECLTLSRPVDILARSEKDNTEVRLQARGDKALQKLADTEGEWTLELLESEERSVFDGSCSGDRVRTGREIQLLATWRRNAR